MGNSATLWLFAALLGVSTLHHLYWPIGGRPEQNNIFLIVLLFIIGTEVAATEEPEAEPSLPDHLVVANSASWVPYSFLDQEGKPRGILTDLWRLFAEKNGISIEFKLVDWEKSIELVRSGAADVHGGLIATPAREDSLHFFPNEILRIRTLVFIHEDIEFRTLTKLTNTEIGVVVSSHAEGFLHASYPNIKLKPYPNEKLMVEAAVAGKLKAFVSDYPTGYFHLIALESLDLFDTGPTLYTLPIRAATRKNNSRLSDSVAAGARKIPKSEHERITERWFVPPKPPSKWSVAIEIVIGLLLLFAAIGAHFLSLRRTIKIKTAALQEVVIKLEATNRELDLLARTDSLTGIANRRSFFEQAPIELARAKRYGHTFSLAMLDLDDFKAFNDQYGHQAGDDVLCHLTKIVSAQLRSSDLFARFGGEEFILLLPETGLSVAASLLERALKDVMTTHLQYDEKNLIVSFSAGVTEFCADATLDALIKQADTALYHSKESGRSRISLSPDTNDSRQ
jgi:diguanylate cyclase (GGDEF)-like protein